MQGAWLGPFLLCSGSGREGGGRGAVWGERFPNSVHRTLFADYGAELCSSLSGLVRVSSNNTALGSPGSSVALAINHPLTVRSCKGGNCSHVATVPPPHGRRGRGGFLCLGPPQTHCGP